MSQYLEQAQIHETQDTVEIRFHYNEIEYALAMSQAMFDLLDVSCGQTAPVLCKVMIGLDHPSWSGGVMLTEEGFEQA